MRTSRFIKFLIGSSDYLVVLEFGLIMFFIIPTGEHGNSLDKHLRQIRFKGYSGSSDEVSLLDVTRVDELILFIFAGVA